MRVSDCLYMVRNSLLGHPIYTHILVIVEGYSAVTRGVVLSQYPIVEFWCYGGCMWWRSTLSWWAARYPVQGSIKSNSLKGLKWRGCRVSVEGWEAWAKAFKIRIFHALAISVLTCQWLQPARNFLPGEGSTIVISYLRTSGIGRTTEHAQC